MGLSQDRIFANFEIDKWFKWNKAALKRFDPETQLPLKLMELYNIRPHSVLEVGAANGFRLAAIPKGYGTRVVAVEVSVEATHDGKARFPWVEFLRGAAVIPP